MKLFAYLCILSNIAYAQSTTLDMQSYLSALQSKDIEYQRILKDLDQLNFNKDLNMPSRQYLLEVKNEYGIILGDGQTTKTLGTSLSKEFQDTGTQVSVFFNKNELIGRDEQTLGVRVEQDLLKNAFGKGTRQQSDMIDIENQILYLQVIQAYEDYIENKMQAFINLQKSYLELQAAQALQTQSQKIQKDIVEKRKSNIAFDVDVDRITLQNLMHEERLLAAQTQMQMQTQAIGNAVGISIDLTDGLNPWDMTTPTLTDIDQLLTTSRALQIVSLQEKALTQSALLAKRNRYPDLNLVLGLNRDDFTRFNVSADRNEAVIGFNLSAPLGDSQSKAQEKSALLAASIAGINKEVLQRDLKTSLETLAMNIQHQEKIQKLAHKKQQLSNRIVSQQQRRYNRGQIDLDQWIDAQNTLENNNTQAIQSTIELTSLILQWQNLTDQLIQKNDVSLKKQP